AAEKRWTTAYGSPIVEKPDFIDTGARAKSGKREPGRPLAWTWACRRNRSIPCDGDARSFRNAVGCRPGTRLKSRPIASAWASDGREYDQPAHREAVVQRSDRLFAAGTRTR